MRLPEVELAIAGSALDQVVERGRWAPWNFERGHRAWDEYRGDAALVLSTDEWVKVSVGFYAIDAVERTFAKLATGTAMVPSGQAVIAEARRSSYDAANALRRRMGVDEIRPGP
jgi:hypothetical protein